MLHRYDIEYVLPLGRIQRKRFYGIIRGGRTLYVHNDQTRERIGYAVLEYTPRRRGQRTIDDFLGDIDPPAPG